MHANSPRFSVIVPTYNRPDLLRKTIDSVFAQDYQDFELIVVDDGSTDDTPATIRSYGDRLVATRQENAGQGMARNRGAEMAHGAYLAFLDSDDYWLPWTLRVFDEALAQHADPGLLVGTRHYFSHEAEASQLEDAPMAVTRFQDFLAMQRREYTPAGSGTMVVQREAFLRSGGFDQVRCNSEDVDLYLRLGAVEGCLRLESPVTLACRLHEENSSKDLQRSVEGLEYLLRREREGVYPGGAARQLERWAVLTFQLRNMSLRMASAGKLVEAMRCYSTGFGAHLRLGRWRYLTFAPLLCLLRRAKAALS